tara:strand:+ start:22260 stop:23243 length:984 start_codon:yes stop_codon:yes gene_type:complete
MEFNTNGHVKVTKEWILSCVREVEIFKHYIPSFKVVGRPFCSELRRDRKPSCSVRISARGKGLYIDYATGEKMSPYDYVMAKYGIIHFGVALHRIADDMNLSGNNKSNGITYGAVEIKKGIDIDIVAIEQKKVRIVSKPFTYSGLAYWKSFGISKKILEKFNIKELEGFFLSDLYYKCKLGYAYCFGKYRYKILQPYKDFKWMTNVSSNFIQGYSQLPKSGNTLFITKSLKDVMTLYTIGAYAVAPQSESSQIHKEAVIKFKKNWKNIIIYYDNDKAGLEHAKLQSELHSLPYIYNPLNEPKDASDYYKKYGKESLKTLIRKLLERK